MSIFEQVCVGEVGGYPIWAFPKEVYDAGLVGIPDKVYRYGPYREVEVDLWHGRGAIFRNTTTGKQVAYTGKDTNRAFGEARYKGEHYRIVNRCFKGD